MNASPPSRLPTLLRARVVVATVVAGLLGITGLIALGVVANHTVVLQAKADALVRHAPHQVGTYVHADDDASAGLSFSWDSDESVRLEDGRTVPLWRSDQPDRSVSLTQGEEIEVIEFPGRDLAFLVDEVPADHPLVLRVIDWALLMPGALRGIAIPLAALYGIVRLILGFTPRALPSLLRRRAEVTGVVDGFWPTVDERRGDLHVAAGSAAYVARVKVRGDRPRVGDPITLRGSVRPGGWVVAWTERGVVVPREPLRADVPVPRP
ncbi:hypothetical protein [Mumia sp. ZJ430]|uniref:hypothetical protein n=1 Tax=Mumia sp. ZJ430 TaxID=2708083 RepID=UPI00141E1309|nr:hypothetical protein [Mumia sp. ZJ430]